MLPVALPVPQLAFAQHHHRAASAGMRPVRQAIQANMEAHQLAGIDLAYRFHGAGKLVRAHQFADGLLAPVHAARLAFQNVFPGLGRVRFRHEQEGPRFGRRGIIKLPERRRAIRGRTLRGVRKHINAQAVRVIIVLLAGAVDFLFHFHQTGQFAQKIRGQQTGMHLFHCRQKFLRHPLRLFPEQIPHGNFQNT